MSTTEHEAPREQQLQSATESAAPPVGEEIHLPGPSVLPLVTAVGITLAVIGTTIDWKIWSTMGVVDHGRLHHPLGQGHPSRRGVPARRAPPLTPDADVQKYRMRTPSTGREVIVEAQEDREYTDRQTGEKLQVVAELLPLAPTPSELPWAIENLRFCNHCDQLAQKDLNDCPHCGRRMDPLPA